MRLETLAGTCHLPSAFFSYFLLSLTVSKAVLVSASAVLELQYRLYLLSHSTALQSTVVRSLGNSVGEPASLGGRGTGREDVRKVLDSRQS